MSMRRAPAATTETAVVPGAAFVTDTGFGVCTNGAIGFADDVIGMPVAVSTAAAAAAAPLPLEAKKPVKMASKSGSSSKILSNRDAQRYMGMPKFQQQQRSMSVPALRSKIQTRPLSSPSYSSPHTMCTCPDGGICEDDYATATPMRARAYSAKATKPATTTFTAANAKKANELVFEAMTGRPYTASAAREHRIVDIFSTFPDGVPVHAGMSRAERDHADELSGMLMKARADVMECVALGKRLGPGQRKLLKELHAKVHHFHGTLDVNGDDGYQGNLKRHLFKVKKHMKKIMDSEDKADKRDPKKNEKQFERNAKWVEKHNRMWNENPHDKEKYTRNYQDHFEHKMKNPKYRAQMDRYRKDHGIINGRSPHEHVVGDYAHQRRRGGSTSGGSETYV